MISVSFHDHLDYVRHIVAHNGPDVTEYAAHIRWYDTIKEQFITGAIDREQLNQLRLEFGDAYLTPNTLQGASYVKQHGYPGDFCILEKIYAEETSCDERFRKYDEFFHAQAAPKAVRNRKKYFKDLVRRVQSESSERIRVLNLACGPCREMKELFDEGLQGVDFVCVDGDRNAIRYAQTLLGDYTATVRFVHNNVLRYSPSTKFHLIWSAGLFDYFDDRVFLRVLSRYLTYLRAGGEIAIGNFGMANPTRAYMEALAQWYLHHRSDSRLLELAKAAKTKPGDKVSIDAESTGVNRFLHISRTGRSLRIGEAHGNQVRRPLGGQLLNRTQSQ